MDGRPSAPAWPTALSGTGAVSGLIISSQQPPPPPDSPSGTTSDDEDNDHDDGWTDGDTHANPDQAQQAEALRAGFVALAGSSPTIDGAQFRQLLKGHLRAHASPNEAQDDAAMDSELAALWIELPKALDEGVTFAALLAALRGEDASAASGTAAVAPFTNTLPLDSPSGSPVGSRRGSLSSGADFDLPVGLTTSVSGPAAGGAWAAHRKSASGGRVAGGAAGGIAAAHANGGAADPLFRLFAPRRPSIKVAASRSKRYSESGRSGLEPASAPPADQSRPRSHTLFPTPSSKPVPSAISSPVAAAASASGALDLDDPDWSDLSWLVAAHPAAFSAAAASPRTSFSISPAASSTNGLSSPLSPLSASSVSSPASSTVASTILVSSSALQIAMQHYLGRWLNQHELNVIATMHKFATPTKRRTGPSGAPVPQQDLLSLDVLQRAVASVHAVLKANGASSSPVVDPLPSFAFALGLCAEPMHVDDLLAHLQTFSSVLQPEQSQSLIQAFGGGVLHSAPLLGLLGEHRALGSKHARLEAEYSLLTAHRVDLDSSHADLSEQLPYLQERIATLTQEKAALASELIRAADTASAASAHKAAHDRLQKRLQQAQEDSAALRNEVQHGKEALLASEEEVTAAQAQEARTLARLTAVEGELRELQTRSNARASSDAIALRHASEERLAQESKYQDLLERSQIFYRRLVAVGEHQELESPEGTVTHPGMGIEAGTLVGSLARSQLHLATRLAGTPRNVIRDDFLSNGEQSLGAELDHAEMERIRQQVALLSQKVQDKDREIERLHAELGPAKIKLGASSDGEDKTKGGCCTACAIM